jgi:hypothetical protein
VCVYMCICIYVCVYMCVRERERERVDSFYLSYNTSEERDLEHM